MNNVILSARKLDILDDWKNLCIQRRLAYENNNMEVANELNRQLMQKRIESGWTDLEVKEEFEVYAKVLQQPFSEPLGNMNIRYDILDENGRGLGLSLTLPQVSQYWKYRDAGLKHSEALQKSL